MAAKKLPKAKDGFCFVQNEAGGGCSFDGVSYEPNEDGLVEVPVEALGHILNPLCGFVLMSEAPAEGIAEVKPIAPASVE